MDVSSSVPPDDASDAVCELLEDVSMPEDDRTSFYEQLSDFPHSFQLKNQRRIDVSTTNKLRKGLESALSVGYKTSMENARAKNLLAFAYHKLGRSGEAIRKLDEVLNLDDQQNNLVNLANRAVILRDQGEKSAAEEQLQRLNDIRERNVREFPYLVVKAQAELAFSYTRLGLSFYDFAIEVFKEVIPLAREPEVWLWKFGLALTRRRNIRWIRLSQRPFEESLEEQKDVLRLYMDILDRVDCPTFKAKIYSEVAVLLDITRNSETARKELSAIADGLSRTDACDLALKLDNEDKSVLCKCGRVLRFAGGRTEEACMLLRKALGKRPSATGYHHLGLTLKGLAENRRIDEAAKLTPHVVNSPFHSAITLTEDDEYATEALETLKKAVEYSEGQNTRAALDLALLQRSFGHLEDARDTLLKMKNEPRLTSIFDQITKYDQLGSIMNQIADAESDETKKAVLRNEGNAMLRQALNLASRNFASSTTLKENIGELWLSFPALMQDVDKSNSSIQEKKTAQAVLLHLIRKYQPSLDILKQLQEKGSDKTNDPAFLKLYIEGYVGVKQYKEALIFAELLSVTTQKDKVMKLFDDEQFLLKLYICAAKEALQENSDARSYFHTVYEEIIATRNDSTSGSEDTSAGEDDKIKNWDLTIVHEDYSREKAVLLAELFHDVCGLEVPILDRDLPPNKLEIESTLRMMKRSCMVVVLAGARKVSKQLRYYIGNVATRTSTVTLLAEGSRVPEMLRKSHRSFTCPPELFTIANTEGKAGQTAAKTPQMTPAQIDAVCETFCFLVNLDVDFASDMN